MCQSVLKFKSKLSLNTVEQFIRMLVYMKI